jgi:hypothetical protein
VDFYTGKIKEHFGNKQILPYLFLFNPQHKPPNPPKLPLSPVKPAAKPHAPHAQKPPPSPSRKNYIGHNFTHKGNNFSYKASNFSNNGYRTNALSRRLKQTECHGEDIRPAQQPPLRPLSESSLHTPRT